ncbi:MAG TPA: AAA family ATPase [Phycisphaerales bacterium]|nr:AAA family ATPase [Phycisphaerales bacterium]
MTRMNLPNGALPNGAGANGAKAQMVKHARPPAPTVAAAAGATGSGQGADELDVLIRARYPVIYVVSWEEARVEQHLQRIAARRNKALYTWSVTSGLQKVSEPGSPRGKGPTDPIEAMTAIIEQKEPAIYLFKDLNPLLRAPAPPCNVPTIRKVREVAQALSDSYKTMVICSPLMELAPELEKDVTVLDYPLPTPEDLSALLDRIAKDVADNTSVTINLDDKGREALVRAAGGLTLQEAENVFAKTIVKDGSLDASDVSTVFSEKQQIVRKSGLLEYYESTADLKEVGGLDQLKEWLDRRSRAFTEEARVFGLPAPKGVLLVGVQGCGKSLCAKAVSRAWDMPLLRFDVGRMFSSLVGSSEQNVRRAIQVAESIAPAVLWVDEIDKAFAGSSSSGRTDGGTTARVMSTFLTWLNEKQAPVFVLATANDISQLPPELLRKGRLDEIFFVDLPNEAERRAIFEIHLTRRKRSPGSFDLGTLIEASRGFSGAEIEQAIISALYDVFYKGTPLTTEDLLNSIRETVPLSRTMSERIDALREWASGRARFATMPSAEAQPAVVRRKLEV